MEISLEKIYRIAKKKFIWIIIAAILFGVAAYIGVTYLTAPIYTISGQFYIYDPTKEELTSSTRNLQINAANTYVAILSANDFFDLVNAKIKADPESFITDKDGNALPEDAAITADELVGSVYSGLISSGTSYSIITDTEVITVRFQSGNRKLVYPVMKAIMATVEEQIQTSYNEQTKMKYVETPKPTSVGVSTSRRRTVTLIVAAVGAVLALLFFYVRDMLDIHIRGANTIVEKYRLPVLGRVPSFDPSLLAKKEASGDVKKEQ
ncbi:MAG: hypothetical protein J5793_04380 [Clostridia bacterium]|nr:hypothetical protein [Clostridia bacterium]